VLRALRGPRFGALRRPARWGRSTGRYQRAGQGGNALSAIFPDKVVAPNVLQELAYLAWLGTVCFYGSLRKTIGEA
jgi:hypothetical protein